MNREPQTEGEHGLAFYLHQIHELRLGTGNDLRQHGYTYANHEDFLLQHGVWYRPRRLSRRIRKGPIKRCYANALRVAIQHGLSYVEGYANSIIPVAHAWCTNDNGQLYEVTWPEPGSAYLGVVFSVERAHDATWNGDASVLDDFKRGFPVLAQPWTGEPANFPWPDAPFLRLARAGQWVEALAWLRDHMNTEGEP